MPVPSRLLAVLLALTGLALQPSHALGQAPGTPPATAQVQGPVQVSSGVSYEFLARWDIDRLNRILTTDTPAFAALKVDYTPAHNAVRLYRVTYPSVIPERGNRPTVATGLIAIPEVAGKTLPLVSYQHGTVYGKQQVPSFPDQSPETQLAIAQFAGQGYVVIGADYFGMGLSTEPEGYMVKESHQQATHDMIGASRAVLAQMGLSSADLFLAGWSQGGYVTMALLERLESSGEAVKAAATASAPVDLYVGLTGFLNFPRKIDAPWVTTLFILSSFSYENYYGVPGLARSILTDEFYEISRRAYEKQPVDPAQIPTDLRKLIRRDYFDPQFFAASAYGRLVAASQAYRWAIRTPVRNFYGETDEVISIGLGQLAMNWQRALGNDKVEAISTGPTTHRGTFARAVPEWKKWFDGMR
jgi:pimeloyl-ACP methyl ester carboxylesterase